MRALVLLATLFATSVGRAAEMPRELIVAMLKSPWPVYPAVPSLSEQMCDEIANDIARSQVVRQAVQGLNPENGNSIINPKRRAVPPAAAHLVLVRLAEY